MEKPASTRQLKVAREIQKDLAEIIRSKGMSAMGGALVTVSEVRVSPDLSVAKVFVSIFPSEKQSPVMQLLEEKKMKQLQIMLEDNDEFDVADGSARVSAHSFSYGSQAS